MEVALVRIPLTDLIVYIMVDIMKTARLFKTGRSKAVRLPKSWIGDTTEVELERRGKNIILRPKQSDLWQVAEECALIGGPEIKRLPQTKSGVRAKF
jgi:virulence-associated protein VagC